MAMTTVTIPNHLINYIMVGAGGGNGISVGGGYGYAGAAPQDETYGPGAGGGNGGNCAGYSVGSLVMAMPILCDVCDAPMQFAESFTTNGRNRLCEKHYHAVMALRADETPAPDPGERQETPRQRAIALGGLPQHAA